MTRMPENAVGGGASKTWRLLIITRSEAGLIPRRINSRKPASAKARRGAGCVLDPCRKAVPIGDHEVEVADTRRVEARIVDLAQAAAF